MKHSQKILGDIWKELELSLENSKHPFHIFTITTINGNFPDSRYVVLRNVKFGTSVFGAPAKNNI